MWGVLNSFLHGAALLGTAGVRAETFAPLAARMTTVVAGYVTAAAPEVDAGCHPAGDATLTVHQEAMRHLAEESEALGVNAELPRLFQLLADRAGVDEIRAFATLLIQSSKLGSSIAQTLRIYAAEMREKRRMRAEEKAHRLPVLLSIPLVGCMLPVMIGVLMLPVVAVPTVSQAFDLAAATMTNDRVKKRLTDLGARLARTIVKLA